MHVDPNEGQPDATSQPQDMYSGVRLDDQGPRPTGVTLPPIIQTLFQRYKTVLTHPSVATFEAELPTANWQAVWVGVAIMAVAWALMSLIVGAEQSSPYSSGPSLGGALGIGVLLVVAFFFGSGIYHLIAKLLGGTGSFLPYAYAISLVIVPLDTVAGVALIIPVLGALVFLAAGVYSIYLLVLATQAAHRLTTGKAVAVVLIPSAVAVILSCALSSLFILLLLALSGAGR